MKTNYIKNTTKLKKTRLTRSFIMSMLCCFFTFYVSAQEATIEFTKDSNNLILSFTETHGVMASKDIGTTLKVYGNGLVKVHHPIYMKKAGDYQMLLDDESLNELLQTLAKKSIPEIDISEVQSEKNNRAAKASLSIEPELFAVFDASVTTIEINLDRYTKKPDQQANGSNVASKTLTDTAHDILNLKKKISWEGLREDSNRFPDIEAIQNLAATQLMLLEMTDSNQLVRSE